MKQLSAETLISWLGALVVGVAVTITFAYANFETKDHAKERADMIIQRLDRISDYSKRLDEKIDQVLLNQHAK